MIDIFVVLTVLLLPTFSTSDTHAENVRAATNVYDVEIARSSSCTSRPPRSSFNVSRQARPRHAAHSVRTDGAVERYTLRILRQ